MGYFDDDAESESDDIEQQRLIPDDDPTDGRTPLDKTIDRIGMGELNCDVVAFHEIYVVFRQLPVDSAITLWFW